VGVATRASADTEPCAKASREAGRQLPLGESTPRNVTRGVDCDEPRRAQRGRMPTGRGAASGGLPRSAGDPGRTPTHLLRRAAVLLCFLSVALSLAAEVRAASLPLTCVMRSGLVETTIAPIASKQYNGCADVTSINLSYTDPTAGVASLTATYTGPAASPNLVNLDFQVSVATGSLSTRSALILTQSVSASFTVPGASGPAQIFIQPSFTSTLSSAPFVAFFQITGPGVTQFPPLLSSSTLTLMAGQTYTLELSGEMTANSGTDKQVGVTISLAPEPSTALLLFAGIAGIAVRRRRARGAATE